MNEHDVMNEHEKWLHAGGDHASRTAQWANLRYNIKRALDAAYAKGAQDAMEKEAVTVNLAVVEDPRGVSSESLQTDPPQS